MRGVRDSRWAEAGWRGLSRPVRARRPRHRPPPLRQLVAGQWDLLSGWLARQHGMTEARLAAELGDAKARRRLGMWLARLRERAGAGDEHAREFLAENPDWRDYRAERAD
jgi:hypothetical protein